MFNSFLHINFIHQFGIIVLHKDTIELLIALSTINYNCFKVVFLQLWYDFLLIEWATLLKRNVSSWERTLQEVLYCDNRMTS